MTDVEPAARKHIIVVGSGFAGMAAVKALKGADVTVTLIDRTNHHLFQPLLYQVSTAALSPADIATASRVLLRRQSNVTILMSEVEGVDPARRIVRITDAPDLSYDYLVLATGAAYSFFGRDDWAQYTQVLKSLDDALSIRERLLDAFEWAEECGDPALVRRLLTFVVVGAGPTGVEMAGTIAELARATLARDFKNIDTRSSRVVLCEAGPRVLSAFPNHLSDYAADALRDLGVEVRLGEAVAEIDALGLRVGDTRIDAANVLWCAGTEARPAARWIGASAARNGAIKVLPDCSVPGHPEIFAIGDVASFTGADGRPVPLSQSRHHGDHRPLPRDRRFRPLQDHRLCRVAGLVDGSPDAAGRSAQPRDGVSQLVLGLVHLWPRGPPAHRRHQAVAGGSGDQERLAADLTLR
jgi:NADH dehydrogenase